MKIPLLAMLASPFDKGGLRGIYFWRSKAGGALFFFLLFFSLFSHAEQTPEEIFVQHITEEILTPAYSSWAQQSKQFSISAQSFCRDEYSLKKLRKDWRTTRQAWSALLALPVGPLTEKSYMMQVGYWPDKKNLVAFQVENYLKQNSDISQLPQASVALRGLTTSEYILFDNAVDLGNKEKRKHYCPLLVAVTDYQAQLSMQVEQEWIDFVQQLQHTPNKRFLDEKSVIAEIFRAQVLAWQVQNQKFGVPLGVKTPQPYQAEYWRSAQSIASLRDSLVMDQKLWEKSGWRSLIENKDEDLALSIDQTYNALFVAIDKLPATMDKLLMTPEGVKTLRDLQSHLLVMNSLYGSLMAKTLGVQIGFNSNDGD